MVLDLKTDEWRIPKSLKRVGRINLCVMKILKVIVTVLAISAAAMTTGCQKDDIAPSGQSTSPNLSNRGGLAFIVKDAGGTRISGARIGIALSQGELVTNNYLASRITDSNGYADFGKLNSGNYYYEVDVTVGSSSFHGEGVLQVQSGVDLVQELTLQ